jgi:hypothetical protein
MIGPTPRGQHVRIGYAARTTSSLNNRIHATRHLIDYDCHYNIKQLPTTMTLWDVRCDNSVIKQHAWIASLELDQGG